MTSTSTSTADKSANSDSPGVWSTLRDRLKPPRLLSMTRAGKFFILITLAVGFGAINTGNNLLFLLFGMMLSLIIASGILSEAVLRHIDIRRRLPRRVTARHPAPGRFRLLNSGPWPALSVEASEQNPRAVRGPLAGRRIGPRPVPWWKFWRRQTDDERRPLAAAYTLRIDAGDELHLSTHYEFPARGEYELPGVQLRTRFPFALFEKSRRFPAPARITVLPAGLPTEEWLGTLDGRKGDTARNRRGRGEDFYGLREYRPGEDQRAIHWKSTARRGEPVVREHEARQHRAVLLVFDNRAPDNADPGAYRDRFERGVRHVAGFIDALHRRGYRLQLSTVEGTVRPDTAGDAEPLLRHLAIIDLHPGCEPPPSADDDPDTPERRIIVGFGDVVSSAAHDSALLIDDLSVPEENAP